MTNEAQWKDNFSAVYAFRQAQKDCLEYFILKQAKSHEVWMTEAQNINDWMNSHRHYLIHWEFVKNEPVFFDMCCQELTNIINNICVCFDFSVYVVGGYILSVVWFSFSGLWISIRQHTLWALNLQNMDFVVRDSWIHPFQVLVIALWSLTILLPGCTVWILLMSPFHPCTFLKQRPKTNQIIQLILHGVRDFLGCMVNVKQVNWWHFIRFSWWDQREDRIPIYIETRFTKRESFVIPWMVAK